MAGELCCLDHRPADVTINVAVNHLLPRIGYFNWPTTLLTFSSSAGLSQITVEQATVLDADPQRQWF